MAGQQDYRPGFKQGCAAESEYPELWRGLVGAWVPSLGCTGERLLDGSGKRGHGAFLGTGSHWQPSQYGPLVSFNGTNDAVDCGWFSAAGAGPFTVLVGGTANSGGDNNGAWISNNPGSNFRGPFLVQNETGDQIRAYSGSQSLPAVSVAANVPHDIALIRYPSAVGIELVVDGKSLASASGNSGVQTGQKLYLGYRDGLAQHWSGVLRYAYIYNRVLPPRLRQNLAADPLALFRLRRPVYASASRRPFAAYRRLLASAYGASP